MKDVSEIKHVGMTVTDIPTMIEWYKTNFGFEVTFQTTFTAYKDGFFGESFHEQVQEEPHGSNP